MLREIRQLQHKNEKLEQQHKALLQKYAKVEQIMEEQIMETLKDDRRFTVIVDRLRRGDDPRSVAQWLGRSTNSNSKAQSPASGEVLTLSVEVHGRDRVDKLHAGQLSPGMEPMLAPELVDQSQRACYSGMHGMRTSLDSPSEVGDTERQKCVPISSLLNSD